MSDMMLTTIMNYGQVITARANTVDNSLDSFLAFVAIFRAYVIPAFLFIGVFGNCLSVVVFYKCDKKDSATVQYLSFLAVADCANMFLVTLRQWLVDGLRYITNGETFIDIFLYSVEACKVGKFSYDVFSFLSAWILVVFSLERCFVVLFPLKAATVIIASRRWKVLLGLLVITILWNAKSIGMAAIYIEPGRIKTCFFSPEILSPFVLLIVGSVQFFLNSFLPCLLILILNIILCLTLWRSTKTSVRNQKKISEKEIKCIWNLVGISCLYVLSTSPQVIMWTYFRILKLIYYEQGSTTGESLHVIYAIATFCTLLTTFNYSLNFLIYNISLDFYNDTVKAIFFGKTKKIRSTDRRQ